MKQFLGSLSLCFWLLTSPSHAADKSPNIVFILADDLGWAELGSYGQKKIQTPRLDQLAREGMRFTRTYSGNAVCAPSRCVLMTGKHPGHAEVRSNKALKPEGQWPIPASDVTLAELLMEEGYVSGGFGKWGLGPVESSGDPLNQGFQRFFGYNCQSHAHSYYPATLWSDRTRVPLKNDPPVPGHASLAEGADPTQPESYAVFQGQDYASDHINDAALEFLETHQKQPFFLYYPTLIPHVALHVPDEDVAPYRALGWEDPPFTREGGYGYTPHFTPRAAYAGMITRMDRYVGKILDRLKALGLEKDTIVVFTSDNGTTHLGEEVDYNFFESVKPLRGLKGSLYEGGIRVPQIVRWPGIVEPGSVSDRVVGFEDWLPTLMDLVNAKGKCPHPIDGISFAETLLGEDQPEREFLYREFAGYHGQQAVWMGKWKGVRQNLNKPIKGKDPLTIELFDLETDVAESNNVADQHPEIVEKIREIMTREHVPSETFPLKALDE